MLMCAYLSIWLTCAHVDAYVFQCACVSVCLVDSKCRGKLPDYVKLTMIITLKFKKYHRQIPQLYGHSIHRQYNTSRILLHIFCLSIGFHIHRPLRWGFRLIHDILIESSNIFRLHRAVMYNHACISTNA